jgi:soluble lytic murein transglycosylase-like protein
MIRGLPTAAGSGRRAFTLALTGWALFGRVRPGWAGAQVEEPLVDAVRNALGAAIRAGDPPQPVFTDTDARMHYLRWKVEMNLRLVARRCDLATLQSRDEFLQTAWYNGKRAKLDVALVLGLIQVESNFRKYAVSAAGARGYMQVMPFWTRLIGDGDADKLFHMHANLRFGCVILRHYLDLEKDDLFLALGRYNGSRGKAPYPDAVLQARKQWEFSDG